MHKRNARSAVPPPLRNDSNWLVQDHLGSTIALTDAAGTVARTYAYDVDGNGTTSGSGPETWIKYAGGHDIGGGLYHFGARFYQPSTARWTQQDSLEQPGDLRQHNRYAYVGGDPVNHTDPAGESARAAGAACAGGVIGGAMERAYDGKRIRPTTGQFVRNCAFGVAGAGGFYGLYKGASKGYDLVKKAGSWVKKEIDEGWY